MAGKEATVYIVDCGSTMAETSHGRRQSNLEWALEYVWDKITTTVATGRKTALAGVVGFRTDGTDNELGSEEDYQHITVFQDLCQILMPQLQRLGQELVPSKTDAGDAISALVIAIQMIAKTCKKLRYARKIVLVTDGKAPMQTDQLSEIAAKMKEDGIELAVLGVDFDDAEYGFKEEGKDRVKAENENTLKTLCDDFGGVFGTLAQAVDELGVPRVKSTRPVASFKGLLTLGDPEQYETAMSINVERYPKIMQAKPPTGSKFVARGDMLPSQATQPIDTMMSGQGSNGDGLASVKNHRAYQVEDDNAPGGKRNVEYEELSKGYEYGRTAVHISESDRNVTTYETQPGLDIIGFVDKNQYERYLEIDRSYVILPAKNNDQAGMALSSLIHALYELESYAVARLVAKENKEPRILLLAPNIEPDFECLYDVEMPFAEDVRSYKFPPLDRVVTVSGKTLTMHRNLPSDDLQSAMSDYVDSMDLSSFGKDDEGEPAEYAPMDETYSPMLHRINQVIKHRAVHPTADPPPAYEILTRYANPPEDLIQKSQGALQQVMKAADVKKVPPKARGKRGRKGREPPKPLSELDVGALLAQDSKRKKKRIDSKNAVPEFKQILDNAEDMAEVKDASKQLKEIVLDMVRHSVGTMKNGLAVEMIRVMREELAELEEPQMYNDVVTEIRDKLISGEAGGDRTELWYLMRQNKLGLIQKKDSEQSNVTEEEAKAFLSAR